MILAFVVSWFLNKTSVGLNLRAVGENPATADAAGISVTKYKYLATCIGAGISGFGGLYYTMDYIKGTWSTDGSIEKLGWLAVALVIFATWKPRRSIWGAYLFGALFWLFFYIPGLTRSSQEIFKMLPYLVTVFVLVMVALRRKREDQPPASLGNAYFREGGNDLSVFVNTKRPAFVSGTQAAFARVQCGCATPLRRSRYRAWR